MSNRMLVVVHLYVSCLKKITNVFWNQTWWINLLYVAFHLFIGPKVIRDFYYPRCKHISIIHLINFPLVQILFSLMKRTLIQSNYNKDCGQHWMKDVIHCVPMMVDICVLFTKKMYHWKCAKMPFFFSSNQILIW